MDALDVDIGLYLARFEKASAMVNLQVGNVDAFFTGFVIVAGVLEGDALTVTELRQISAWGDELPDAGGYLDFAGPKRDPEKPAFDITGPFAARMYYPLLGKEEPVLQELDAVYPYLETLSGEINLEILDAGGDFLTGRLSLNLSADPDNKLGAVTGVVLEGLELEFKLLSGSGETPTHHSLSACGAAPPGGNQPIYNLTLRFISMSTVQANQPAANALAHPLENIVQTQIEGACEVWWMNAGIKIVPYQVGGQLDIVEANAKNNGNWLVDDAGLPAFAGQAINSAIEVYLVDDLQDSGVFSAFGGGVTFGNRTRDAFIVLEIGKAENNRYLLAHELGHVLGLVHPGEPLPANYTNDLVNASFCSVMVPDSPMSSYNTATNINQARDLPPLGMVLDAGVGTCTPNLAADRHFFHIVRDFPLDDGKESSVPRPPAFFWWTHSDVWNSNKSLSLVAENRYADNTPMFHPDHSPIHSEPSRLLTNQMYVRLHACDTLANNVNVHLFLAVPGVALEPLTRITPTGAGEANPLVFDVNSYGPFINTSRPAPGAPRYKKIAWSVPPGYPANCCVFAAAVSANEDSGGLANIVNNPANHHFSDLFARLQSDNDVAQRNLHIQNVAPFMDNLLTTLPWLQFANPLEASGPANLVVDATQAVALGELRVLSETGSSVVIDGWQEQPRSLRLFNAIASGGRFNFRLQAIVPPGQAIGAELPLHLSFQVGDQLVGGFTHFIRVAGLNQVAFQVLDLLYAGLSDAAIALHSDWLKQFAQTLGQQTRQHVDEPDKVLQWAESQVAWLANTCAGLENTAGFHTLHATHSLPAHRIQELLLQLPTLLSAAGSMPRPRWLERVRLLADRLQCIAGGLVREKP
jgi:hypothetical protein